MHKWVPEHRGLDTVVSMCSLPSLSQISSSQEEYDCLKVVQSQQISEHQQRLTDATTVPTHVVCRSWAFSPNPSSPLPPFRLGRRQNLT